jgi:hypothetical protein
VAKFSLTIETNDDNEFAAFALRLSGGEQVGPGPAPIDAAGLTAAAKPVRGKKATPPEVGAVEAETAASPATERPTPGEQQTAEQTKTVDPAVAAAQNSDQGAKETKVYTPEPEAPADIQPTPTAVGTGDVTLDSLKSKMKLLLDKGSAKVLQDTIRGAGGGASSIGQVDPSLYGAVNAAFDAALA